MQIQILSSIPNLILLLSHLAEQAEHIAARAVTADCAKEAPDSKLA